MSAAARCSSIRRDGPWAEGGPGGGPAWGTTKSAKAATSRPSFPEPRGTGKFTRHSRADRHIHGQSTHGGVFMTRLRALALAAAAAPLTIAIVAPAPVVAQAN